jgi:hypothetical protein
MQALAQLVLAWLLFENAGFSPPLVLTFAVLFGMLWQSIELRCVQ